MDVAPGAVVAIGVVEPERIAGLRELLHANAALDLSSQAAAQENIVETFANPRAPALKQNPWSIIQAR